MAPQREWFEKDYYKVLGVPASADQKEITKAYRKLARELHPDANPGDARAEERFKEVSSAYDVVGDPDKRKEYDEVRKMGPIGNLFGGGAPGGGNGGFSFRVDDLGDLGDIFGGLFNRGRRNRGGARATAPARGGDLQAELHLSFVDAVKGVTTAVHLTSEAVCSTCDGSGAKPGTTPHVCAACSGRGVTDDNQGLFSFSAPCTVCGGRGVVIDDPCPTCRGTGVERRPREVKVRVPAGVNDGQRIRLAGRGEPGRNGGPPGDLFVVVHVMPHELFGRKGRNLTITVPTLDDGPVTLRVPPGTRTGKTFRVKGRGVPTATSTGDLLVTTEVAVPAKLSAAERKAVEALAAASTESPRAHLGVE